MDNAHPAFAGALAVISGRVVEQAKAASVPHLVEVCGQCVKGEHEYFAGNERKFQRCNACDGHGNLKVAL